MMFFANLGFNFNLPMSNWFMPNLSFPNFNFSFNNIFSFNNYHSISMNNWFMPNFNNYPPMYMPTSLFDYNNPVKKDKLVDISNVNTDTFKKSSIKKDFSKNKLFFEGYNSEKGKKLADIAKRNSTDWTGFCATYVKTAIEQAGLGEYKLGHAYKMTKILRKNPNFKEISPDNVNLKNLPEGCVLVYGKGTEGYSKKYGHTEITFIDEKTGVTKAASDGITKNLYKKPTSIFIPV